MNLLGYIKDAMLALIGMLAAFEIWNPTEVQIGAIVTFYAALSIVAVAINSRRPGGAVQDVRQKAAAAEKAGITV